MYFLTQDVANKATYRHTNNITKLSPIKITAKF